MNQKELIKKVRGKKRLQLPASEFASGEHERLQAQILELQKTQLLLIESLQSHRELFDFAPICFIKINKMGIIKDINVTGASLLGEDRSLLIGIPFTNYLQEADKVKFFDHLIKCTESSERKATELHLSLGNGGLLWVNATSSVFMDYGNHETLYLTAITDLSAQKSNLENVEVINTQLAARSYELEEANKKFNMTIEDLEAFNSTVSHDLRTPLSTIILYTQAVFKHCGGNMDDQCRTYMQNILGQAEYMDQLINILMGFSQVSCKEIQHEMVDLSAIARRIAAQLKLNNMSRKVEFKFADQLVVSGDRNLLEVVVDNLLGNAWKYTSMKDPATIEFGVTEHDGKPVYFIRDNGIGFDMRDSPKLFKIFQRLPNKEAFKGHGIGLASVHRIIQRHGGKIWAEGYPNQGATFYFTL
jgi:signal transduction histidine kinase